MHLTRHDDLKEMLDTNKDSLKLEAMKRIVAVSREGAEVHGGGHLGICGLLFISAMIPSSPPLLYPDDRPWEERLRPISCSGEERSL
jgi:hypothetical protein